MCTITSGGTLTFVSAGTCTIDADQAGDADYLPAPTVSRSFTVIATVPGAPTTAAATSGDTQATVAFVAPASSGGASIFSYTVTANPGGATGSGASSPITVTGLTNGVAYTFFPVTATNSAGTGSASAASNSVTPQAAAVDHLYQPRDAELRYHADAECHGRLGPHAHLYLPARSACAPSLPVARCRS